MITIPKKISPDLGKEHVFLDMTRDRNPLLKNTGTLVTIKDAPQPKTVKPVEWTGGKLSREVWERLTYVLFRSFWMHKRESTVTLFYHRKRQKWTFGVPLQAATSGLAVYKIPQDNSDQHNRRLLGPLVDKDLSEFYDRESEFQALIRNGWNMFGSVHHHCNAGAGQSPMDFADEIDSPGLHITLGNMGSKALNAHVRLTYQQVQYAIDLDTIVEDRAMITQTVFTEPLADLEKIFAPVESRFLKLEDLPNKYKHQSTTSRQVHGFANQASGYSGTTYKSSYLPMTGVPKTPIAATPRSTVTWAATLEEKVRKMNSPNDIYEVFSWYAESYQERKKSVLAFCAFYLLGNELDELGRLEDSETWFEICQVINEPDAKRDDLPEMFGWAEDNLGEEDWAVFSENAQIVAGALIELSIFEPH
jgi:hypothetical protein